MKHRRDTRITASSVSLKQFFVIFFAILFTCGTYHVIYVQYLESQPGNQEAFPAVMLGLLLAVSLV